jgi:hypothetical protein
VRPRYQFALAGQNHTVFGEFADLRDARGRRRVALDVESRLDPYYPCANAAEPACWDTPGAGFGDARSATLWPESFEGRCRPREPSSLVPVVASYVHDADSVGGLAAKIGQLPGMPFSSWSPGGSNVMPYPAVRSTTVRDTRISPGPASAATRLAMWTAMPATSSSRSLDLTGVQTGTHLYAVF